MRFRLYFYVTIALIISALPIAAQDAVFTKIGEVKARSANEIESSDWSIGAETMDRDYTFYANWKQYLGPLGIKKARIQGGWAKTEQDKNVYNWAWLDEIIYDMVDQGVEPWVCLCYGNPLYADGGGVRLGAKIPVSDEALKGWRNWVGAFVQRYKDVVDEWEVWNEPQLRDVNNTEAYGNLFIQTAETIREIQPDSTIIAMAMAGVRPELANDFLQYVSDKNQLHLIDKLTYHPYARNPDSSYKAVEQLRATVHKFSDRIQLYQGENGCPSEFRKTKALSGYEWTPTSQAKWALRRMLGDLGRDVFSSYFSICDMKYPDEINRKGLLKINNEKEVIEAKPAYYALQNLASIFDNSLQRISRYEYKTDSEQSLSVFGYENTDTKFQAVTIWADANIPSADNNKDKINISFSNGNFDTPLYVDLRTGDVLKVPDSKWRKAQSEYQFFDVPIYDSPIVIIDQSNVAIVKTNHSITQPNNDNSIQLTMHANGWERFDYPVEIEIDLKDITNGDASNFDPQSILISEVGSQGDIVNPSIQFQYETKTQDRSSIILTFILAGKTSATAVRHFTIRLDPTQKKSVVAPPLVTVDTLDDYEGDQVWKIQTPSAAYFYHIHGGGFASLIDRDGFDWISHHPQGGFEGNFRGIPNIAPADFHPGATNCTSQLISDGPIKVVIESQTNEGKWKCRWEIFPTFARMTLLQKGEKPYWILYEGTPGGQFEVDDDYWVDSEGTRMNSSSLKHSEVWRKDLPDPEWVYFGDEKLKRVLFYLHEPSENSVEEYWHRGDGGMTVFGFGRGDQKIAWQQLEALPKTITLGFLEENTFEQIQTKINAVANKIKIDISQ